MSWLSTHCPELHRSRAIDRQTIVIASLARRGGLRPPVHDKEASPRDRRDLYGLSGVVALLAVTIVLSILTGKQLYVFGYIMAIVYAMHGPVQGYRPWRELGLSWASSRT